MQKLIINIWHHNKYNQSSYLKYLDINNPFDWVEDEGFIKCYEKSKEGYFLEFGIQYAEELHKLHNNLPFLPEKMKI